MRIVVSHPSPGLRRALVEAFNAVNLEATDSPDDLLEWFEANQPACALLPPDHAAWAHLRDEFPDRLLVAIVESDDPPTYARAFAADAAGVTSASWEVERTVHAVLDAIEGFATLPLDVMRTLTSTAAGCPPSNLVLSSTESEALRLLCAGETVVTISDRLGYSDREMHRILSSLYDRMGVASRAEAIVRITQWGLLDA